MPEQERSDFLAQLLDDPEVRAAGEASDAPPSMPVGADAGLLGALPPELLTTLPALMSAIGPLVKGKGAGDYKDDKTALLLALKPYMSPQRCDAIDKLIMFGRIGEIMRQLK